LLYACEGLGKSERRVREITENRKKRKYKMKKLSSNFYFKKYGFTVRLVNEADARFIIELRTRPEVGDFLHSTSNNIDGQKDWIRNYKKREQIGSEYYFVYEKNGIPFGVNRVYNISNGEGTTGSWICAKNTNPIDTLATVVLLYDIVFNEIKLTKAFFNSNKNNNSALKVNHAIGGDYLYESDTDVFFELRPEKYNSIHDRLLRRWHLKI